MRALRISQGDIPVLFSSVVGNVLWAMLVLSLILPYMKQCSMKRQRGKLDSNG